MGGLAYLGGFSQTQLSPVNARWRNSKALIIEDPTASFTKTPLGYRFRAWEPSKKMRLDESFRYLCLTPQNMLLVTILNFVFWGFLGACYWRTFSKNRTTGFWTDLLYIKHVCRYARIYAYICRSVVRLLHRVASRWQRMEKTSNPSKPLL